MVQWKGKLDGEVGRRAAMLDKIESFQVPNFFVITPQETAKLFNDSTDAEQVLNAQLNASMKSEVKDAYGEIGMSSEVRTANGKAKNLVGGQRNSQLVSVRVSGSEKGEYEYQLNIGASKILEAIKQVAVSYYEKNDDHPAIIIQKMVEPDYSGVAITNYLGGYGLIEVVEGLGTSLEEGVTQPHMYLLEEGRVIDTREAEEQLKITRNPINGRQKTKKAGTSGLPFSDSEVEELFEKLSREGLNIKFGYKRGSFYIVDAWQPEQREMHSDTEPSLESIRVSEGEIRGSAGREVVYTDQTVEPEKYQEALITRKGGYTSTDAQKARRAGKPALFSFKGELRNGQELELDERETSVGESHGGAENPNPFTQPSFDDQTSSEPDTDNVIGSEVLPVDPSHGRGVYISPPFGAGYSITDREPRKGEAIPESGYIGSYSQFFSFNEDKAVVDARQLERQGLEEALEYLEADLKILILGRPDSEAVRKAVEAGFDVFATSERQLDTLEKQVLRAEKKFMMDRLREL